MRLLRNHTWLSAAVAGMLLSLVMAVPGNAEVTEDFHRTVPLPASGRISLANINGSVEITGWDHNEVQIDAVKMIAARAGLRSRAGRRRDVGRPARTGSPTASFTIAAVDCVLIVSLI